MTFIKNNREMIVLSLIIVGLFVMTSAIGVNLRGGQAWAYSNLSLASSTRAILASLVK